MIGAGINVVGGVIVLQRVRRSSVWCFRSRRSTELAIRNAAQTIRDWCCRSDADCIFHAEFFGTARALDLFSGEILSGKLQFEIRTATRATDCCEFRHLISSLLRLQVFVRRTLPDIRKRQLSVLVCLSATAVASIVDGLCRRFPVSIVRDVCLCRLSCV